MCHTYRKILVVAGLVFYSLSSAFAYSGGSGTAGDPYQIATKADLLALAATTADYSKYFILTVDIDMEGQVFAMAIIAADTSSSIGFQGTAFTGMFDGNGHKITNFTINGGSNDYLGIFGEIYAGGSVKKLGLENCAVSGASGSYYVGGLVGENYGGISDCYSTGAVIGYRDVGGLVGRNYGSISDCYSTGAISSGSGSGRVGGLVGENYGSISDCYSTGAVSGGSSLVGGLVGVNSGSVGSSFWDVETSGQTTSAGGTGKTTVEMKQVNTFANWDFVETWGIEDNQTYPFLKLTYPVGDLNYDKVIDFFDFAILAQDWLEGL